MRGRLCMCIANEAKLLSTKRQKITDKSHWVVSSVWYDMKLSVDFSRIC